MTKAAPLLRLCTWNIWHGLNPFQQILMLPMETPWARVRRRSDQIEAILDLRNSAFDVFCLQEVNPFQARRQLLERKLGLKSFGCQVNTGIKLNGIGLPPLLSEGLVTLMGSGFRKRRSHAVTLSGKAPEFRSQLGFSISFQLAERRRALIVETELLGRRVAVVNVHLHHGPDTLPENRRRKKSELLRLTRWLAPRLDTWDFLAVCGDFNCDRELAVTAPLTELGLVDTLDLIDPSDAVPPSWDPDENALARLSSEAANEAVDRDWDSKPHPFDRIYLWSRKPIPDVKLTRVFDAGLSDHFGILAEIPF